MTYKEKMNELYDALIERYEDLYNEVINKTKLAKMLHVDKIYVSKLFNADIKPNLIIVSKLSEIFEVPKEVITLEMKIRDIPAINKDGLSELKFLSRKWIYDNSHCEDTKYRVEMLNMILSNSKCADLFFDTLSAFVNGFFIGTNSLQAAYSKSEIEHILFKGFIIEELEEFFKNLYKRTSIYRENRVEEKVNEIFERMKKSKELLKQSRLDEEKQELEMIHQENEDMKKEISDVN